MKAFFIDSEKEEIKEVEYTNWEEISPMLGARCFTVAVFNKKEDCVYIDDEGLLSLTEKSKFFEIEGYPQPLAGNGLVLGTNDEGESVEPSITLEELKGIVTFLTIQEVRARY